MLYCMSNTKIQMLTFDYSPSFRLEKGKHYNICKVHLQGTVFINLGLLPGQSILNEEQELWFEKHGVKIKEVLNEVASSVVGQPAWYAASKKKYKLQDQFCKECKIKDT